MRGRYTNQKRSIEHFGPMLCSCFFSYSYSASRYSYSKRSSIAIRPIGPQATANHLDQRSVSPQFKQPSSTSTVRRGELSTASLGTITTKSDARHERMLCSCKLRLRRASPTVGSLSGHRALLSVSFMPNGNELKAQRRKRRRKPTGSIVIGPRVVLDVDNRSLLEVLKMNQQVPTLVLFYCSQRCCCATISDARSKSSGHSAVFFALLCI
jgi:hypothetical protein